MLFPGKQQLPLCAHSARAAASTAHSSRTPSCTVLQTMRSRLCYQPLETSSKRYDNPQPSCLVFWELGGEPCRDGGNRPWRGDVARPAGAQSCRISIEHSEHKPFSPTSATSASAVIVVSSSSQGLVMVRGHDLLMQGRRRSPMYCYLV